MTRLVWIPVAGTVAALIAIWAAHGPKEDDVHPRSTPPARTTEPPPETEPEDEDENEDEGRRPREPLEQTVAVTLRADGTLLVVDTDEVYDDVDALLQGIAPDGAENTMVMLMNGEGVDEAALDAAVGQMAGKCIPRKAYVAPDK